jgi:hypothetical protein
MLDYFRLSLDASEYISRLSVASLLLPVMPLLMRWIFAMIDIPSIYAPENRRLTERLLDGVSAAVVSIHAIRSCRA